MIAAGTADFRAALPEGGRLLGLDVGTRTIGTALCDSQWTIATPAALIRRSKFAKDLAALKALIEAQRVVGIVVGLPLNLDGSDSPRTQSLRAFARNLAAARPPDPAVGRALVDPGGHPHADRGRRQPRAARRAGRQDGRRLHLAGRDRRAHYEPGGRVAMTESSSRARWSNPLTVAIVAAALAGFSNAYIAYDNNRAQLELEARRAESERILEVLKIGEPNRVRENLRFLLQLGLVQSEDLRHRIEAWEANPRRAPIYLSPVEPEVTGLEGGRRAGAGPAAAPRAREAREAGRQPPANRPGY